MPAITSQLDPRSQEFRDNADFHRALVAELDRRLARAADGGGDKASCDGFQNGPGISDSEVTIGNASDISGPVPGLFESSQDAVKAYVAYFNSSSDICGRKLKLVTYDSRTDAGADQANYA
jgi:ABC-type branched-subunit amino acid transport system substrate-binding protein